MVTHDASIKLMDFGIARNLAEGRTMMTATGQALGTPAYMSPEQVRAQSASMEIGPSSYIYSLCATFYELFTQSRCYDHDTTDQLTIQTKKLEGKKPEHPRQRNRSLPWELNVLLLGGLETEPSDRIGSMQVLAGDIERFQKSEAIEYRRPNIIRRMKLTYKRNTTLINTIAASALFIIIGTVVSFYNINKQKDIALRNEKKAIKNEKIAKENEEEAKHKLGLVFNEKAGIELKNKNFNAVRVYSQLALANFKKEEAFKEKARTLIHSYQDYPIIFSSPDANHHPYDIYCVAYSSDGKTLASGSRDNTIKLWDIASGNKITTLKGHSDYVASIVYSPDGKVLASGSYDDTIKLWDIVSGKEIATLEGHLLVVMSVTYSPDGKTLASGSFDETIKLWHNINTYKMNLRQDEIINTAKTNYNLSLQGFELNPTSTITTVTSTMATCCSFQQGFSGTTSLSFT